MHEDTAALEDDAMLGIPDLGGLPLDAILRPEDSVLMNSLWGLVRNMSRPAEHYAAHGTTP
jgi:hypothetical protein